MGYCYFHFGQYAKAMEVYREILQDPEPNAMNYHYLACCLLYMGMYKEAQEETRKGPVCPLQWRILFNVAHRFNDEAMLVECHKNLDIENPKSPIENQLCFAAVYFLRNHFEEACDTYKRLLLDHRDHLALNVYVAFCYFKLDYYDLSIDILNVYLQSHAKSAIAVNLKACNLFKLYSTAKSAEAELKALEDLDGLTENERALIAHNKVVFRSGDGALQVLPPLVDVIPEARLNLVIYHLRNDDIQDAYAQIKDFEPATPIEFILKAVVTCFVGQMSNSEEHLKIAQHFFNLVGSSPSECDTIPGRQSMASCLFLLKQFDDVLIYLRSIKTFFYGDDNFNYNFGVALAATGQYKDAEEALLLVQSVRITKSDYCYLSWLARCYIMNRKPHLAWDLYVKLEPTGDNFGFLQLIANDCYRTQQYFFAAKAFDVLERLDPNPEYLDGKRGACVGVFQQLVHGRGAREHLDDVINMLRNTQDASCDKILQVIAEWAKSNLE